MGCYRARGVRPAGGPHSLPPQRLDHHRHRSTQCGGACPERPWISVDCRLDRSRGVAIEEVGSEPRRRIPSPDSLPLRVVPRTTRCDHPLRTKGLPGGAYE